MKFKLGDRVKRTVEFWKSHSYPAGHSGAVGTVMEVIIMNDAVPKLMIAWDNLPKSRFPWHPPYDDDLELYLNGLQKAIIKAKEL